MTTIANEELNAEVANDAVTSEISQVYHAVKQSFIQFA